MPSTCMVDLFSTRTRFIVRVFMENLLFGVCEIILVTLSIWSVCRQYHCQINSHYGNDFDWLGRILLCGIKLVGIYLKSVVFIGI